MRTFDRRSHPDGEPYEDRKALKAVHLDAIAKWAADSATWAASGALGYPAWGILRVDSTGSDNDPNRLLEFCGHTSKIKGKVKLLLPDRTLGVFEGEHDLRNVTCALHVRQRKESSIGFTLEFSDSPDAESPSEPLFNLDNGIASTVWPVGFVGATPPLRAALQEFHRVAGETLEDLHDEKRLFRPWLLAARQLTDATPALAATPLLAALSCEWKLPMEFSVAPATQKRPGGHRQSGAPFAVWPRHNTLLAALKGLANDLPQWRTSAQANLQLLEEKPLASALKRYKRTYQKNSGVTLKIAGTLLDVSGDPKWSVAEIHKNHDPGTMIEAAWQNFEVECSDAIVPPNEPIFLDENGRRILAKRIAKPDSEPQRVV